MKIIKEDLHTYAVCDFQENDYYLNTEYPAIRRNHPLSLLPVQIREIDGRKELYYEISGRHPLDQTGDAGMMGYRECRLFLKSLRALFQDLEDYMLSLDQVDFRKEEIYVGAEYRIQWIYLPDKPEDIRAGMEELFLWLLSVLDYRDREAMEISCGALHRLKGEGLDLESIDQLLEGKEETTVETPALSVTGIYGGFTGDPAEEKQGTGKDILPADEPGKKKSREGKKSKKRKDRKEEKKGKTGIRLAVYLFFLFLDMAAFGYLVYCIYLRGSTIFLTACFIAVLLLFVLLFRIGVRLFPSLQGESLLPGETIQAEVRPAPEEDLWKIRPGREKPADIFKEIEGYWEQGNETILLSTSSRTKKPVLHEVSTGESVRVRVVPFYIGSGQGLNQLPLKNRAVSRQHAVIDRGDEGEYYIEDLDSKNGTFLDQKRICPEKPEILREGSQISFADDEWTVTFEVF